MPDPLPGDVTLGEVWRGLQDLKALVKDSFAEFKAEIDNAVEAKTSALKVRVDRLEKIVYGSAVIYCTSLVGLLINVWVKR